MNEQAAIREFLLAFADDEHLMGQQHTEWIGVAPFLEEDLAFSSIGQDELGHAVLLYELVLELDGIEPTDTAIDTLAFGRSSHDYRCCHLVEYTTNHWAEALVRHWVYDAFEEMRWHLVADSSLPRLASIARKAGREEVFHRRHADALLDKLLAAPEARIRILEALDTISPLVPGLCEGTAGEVAAVEGGVAAGPTADLLEPLVRSAEARFGDAAADSLTTDGSANGFGAGDAADGFGAGGSTDGLGADGSTGGLGADGSTDGLGADGSANGQGGRTRRSGWFEPRMARMREVLDYDLEAVW